MTTHPNGDYSTDTTLINLLETLFRRLPIDHIPDSAKVLRFAVLILQTVEQLAVFPGRLPNFTEHGEVAHTNTHAPKRQYPTAV